jgi:hypothetical protein
VKEGDLAEWIGNGCGRVQILRQELESRSEVIISSVIVSIGSYKER